MRIELGVIPKFPSSTRGTQELTGSATKKFLVHHHWELHTDKNSAVHRSPETTQEDAKTMPHGYKSGNSTNYPTVPKRGN